MQNKGTPAHAAYLMLCTCTAILFAAFILISVIVELSVKIIPSGAGEMTIGIQSIFKWITLFLFCLSAFALWIFNWVLLAKTWFQRSVLLNCILVYVQFFGPFINYIVFFIMFYRRDKFPRNEDPVALHPAN